MRQPLVSILIPAYNMEHLIAETLRSAVAQTWARKEIIVVNDGSRDRTLEVANRFASTIVKVVSTENRGLSAAVNCAYSLCQGDYVQELDADDLLAPDKIALQLAALREGDSSRILLSCPWAHFYYRTTSVRFVATSLWNDLSPAEYLLRKMGENVHQQNATWLISREVAEAAGPWDETLSHDQDGEYYCRVLLASEGTRFVPDAKVFYRVTGSRRVSHIGRSVKKKESLLRSMRLHIKYLRSLEDSARVHRACVAYLQNWYPHFCPDNPEMAGELQAMARELSGVLCYPKLRPKYSWVEPMIGFNAARWFQACLPQVKSQVLRQWDKTMYRLKLGVA